MTPCRQTTLASRNLDNEIAQGFPASDPPSLTQPHGEAVDFAGCSYLIEAEVASQSARSARWRGCSGSKGLDDGS